MYNMEAGMGGLVFSGRGEPGDPVPPYDPEGPAIPGDEHDVSQVTLTSTSTSIVLKRVELGNIEQVNTGQLEVTNVAGQARSLKQDYWPIIYKLQLRFNNIRSCDTLDIIQFLEDTLGQEINLIDLIEVKWVGIITSPQAEVTRNHSESFVLDFEGVKK